MRAIIYFLVWTCVTIVLLFTFIYFLTLVDPGLKDLPEKAARVLRNEPATQDFFVLVSYFLFFAFILSNYLLTKVLTLLEVSLEVV